ncbi:2-dehydropantoate 2-reductase [Histoplasma capsulatum var. duboisii H88]|uniref:2-dehydropantoate 2-reductase n=1 Tax=Ajellomyces capsulatus (strain H88) TaxID=544711 RepID=F0UVF5_AJEC8|nr:2-dehydropantoate 2-reductase [Histoplasma capsulatum var. duboisii H88]QSS50913.1 meiotically up-regulated gene 72 protein [Histoplasma capsulatum var. duboisii H88]
MAPSPPRLRILSVGGNAISAFLSWRLQATNACDVTLVWKSSFDAISQFGVTFKSKTFGNERFKPFQVVRTPEEAGSTDPPFDYVILCVKALPDIYDLAAVIQSVVTPQHTCILVNTTSALGVESHLEHRFPTNVVLSLVSGIEISQTGPTEFEHAASTDTWVGPSSKNVMIPSSIQNDMAVALAITLSTGQVDCKVSDNIRQEQYERMIGPIAFYPASVMFECPNHADLLEKVGLRQLISGVIDELLSLAKAQGCTFPEKFNETIIEKMISHSDTPSTMYQDWLARRPMEVETYLGSPIKLATEIGIKIPRIETLYAMLHHLNNINQARQPQETTSLSPVHPPPRLSSAPSRPPMNGMRASRTGPGPGTGAHLPRRGPSLNATHPRPLPNGLPPRGPQPIQRELSEEHNLDEFSHLVLYDDVVEDGAQNGGYGPVSNGGGLPPDIALRERELAIRQRELLLREQEMNMRRGGRRPSAARDAFDDMDEDDYFDPMDHRGPALPQIDPDNFDMLSVTSRRNRKIPNQNAGQFRKNPEMSGGGRPPSAFNRHFGGGGRNRASARLMDEIPGAHDSLLNNPMMGYSSNRYGNVDRKEIRDESRANSLTANNFHPPNRRTSQSPNTSFHPTGRGMGRPPPGHDPYNGQSMVSPGGRPSPPGIMRTPVLKYPPGQGNTGAAQQVDQHVGVSNSYPNKGTPNIRSLTGSASASAGSGDSGASANIDSENSAHSSQSSLGPRHSSMAR